MAGSGTLTWLEQDGKGDEGDRGHWPRDRLPTDDCGAPDRARSGCGSSRESLEPRVLLVPAKPTAWDDNEQIDGQEHGQRGDDRTDQAVHEIPRERRHDHDRAGADQSHRDRVCELLLSQPVVGVNQSFLQERHDSAPSRR